MTTSMLASAALPLSSCLNSESLDIIDTHTHFYDPRRPEGIPWPRKTDPLYRPILPENFKKVTKPQGVIGTIVVEASNRLEDNDWLLKQAALHSNVKGVVGNVDPALPDFREQILRLSKNKFFRGIRLKQSIKKLDDKHVISGLKILAHLNLSVDILGGSKILPAVLKISEKVPDLRQVINHLPFAVHEDKKVEYEKQLIEISQKENVYVKVSNVLRKVEGKAIVDPEKYFPVLEKIWTIFGEDKVIFGSNWPVSERIAKYEDVFNVVNAFVKTKGVDVSRKYFCENSRRAYRWPSA